VALTIGFAASLIAVQAAVSRAIWAAGRDGVLPAAKRVGTLSGRHRMPRYAIALTVLISGPPPFISFSKIYTLLLSFSRCSCHSPRPASFCPTRCRSSASRTSA
jgi:amino acid transporter